MKQLFVTILFLGFIFSACSNSSSSESNLFDGEKYLLKGDSDSLGIFLKYGETIIINNDISITFVKVNNDSRCPINANCIWAGNAEINLLVKTPNEEKSVVVNSSLKPNSFFVDKLLIELLEVNPYPNSNDHIKMEDYKIKISARYTDHFTPKNSVQLVDDKNSLNVNKDALTLHDVSINKDRIFLSLGYAGGCAEHNIDLFALKSIEKSKPAKVELYLSHNANNDNCEAYITSDFVFSLVELKNYLITTHSINDKVLLNIYDPENKLVKTILEYKF